jgi:hypothetical protein
MEWFVALIAKAVISSIAKNATDMAIKQVRARLQGIAQGAQPDQPSHGQQQMPRGPVVTPYRLRNSYAPAFAGRRPSKVVVYPAVSDGTGIGAGAPGLVHDALSQVPRISEYAVISSSLTGTDIASIQLRDHPAIVIRFEAHEGYLDAFAYLHRLFPTTDNASGFEVKAARFGWGPQSSRPHQGPLSNWQYVNLAELEYPDDQIVATILVWFLVNCVQVYWQINGDQVVDLISEFGTTTATETSGHGLVADVEAEHRNRIESEYAELERHGFDVEKWDTGFLTVQLVAVRGDLEVGFVLDRHYPANAPLVVYGNGDERAHLTIDAASWSADCRLLQIVERLA